MRKYIRLGASIAFGAALGFALNGSVWHVVAIASLAKGHSDTRRPAPARSLGRSSLRRSAEDEADEALATLVLVQLQNGLEVYLWEHEVAKAEPAAQPWRNRPLLSVRNVVTALLLLIALALLSTANAWPYDGPSNGGTSCTEMGARDLCGEGR